MTLSFGPLCNGLLAKFLPIFWSDSILDDKNQNILDEDLKDIDEPTTASTHSTFLKTFHWSKKCVTNFLPKDALAM